MRGRLDATGERGGVRAPSRKIFAKKKTAQTAAPLGWCCCLQLAGHQSDGLISQTGVRILAKGEGEVEG